MHKGELQLVIPALVAAIATATGLSSPDTPTTSNRCTLWSFTNVENVSSETWSVITPFGPSPVSSGPNQSAVQVYTQGRTAAAVLAQLAAIHLALLEEFAADDHEPRRSWQIGTAPNQWLVDIFELEEGKIIGNVDQARIDGSLNFILAYRRV